MTGLRMKSYAEIELQRVIDEKMRMKSQQQIMYEYIQRRITEINNDLVKKELQDILNYFDQFIL